MNPITVKFLNNIGLVFTDTNSLNGQLIPRDILLNPNKYEEIQKDIPELKKIFSSSTLTSLHQNANESQKWPLINITRQLLKQSDYKMEPIRKADGIDPITKKKKYKRFFQIQPIKSIIEKDI